MIIVQTQEESIEIDEEKSVIMNILSDKYSRLILAAASKMPRSASELSSECRIPMSTTYRKVQKLYNCKLLMMVGKINDDGKKIMLYKNKIRSLTLNLGARDNSQTRPRSIIVGNE